jgi:hypothetical protein
MVRKRLLPMLLESLDPSPSEEPVETVAAAEAAPVSPPRWRELQAIRSSPLLGLDAVLGSTTRGGGDGDGGHGSDGDRGVSSAALSWKAEVGDAIVALATGKIVGSVVSVAPPAPGQAEGSAPESGRGRQGPVLVLAKLRLEALGLTPSLAPLSPDGRPIGAGALALAKALRPAGAAVGGTGGSGGGGVASKGGGGGDAVDDMEATTGPIIARAYPYLPSWWPSAPLK